MFSKRAGMILVAILLAVGIRPAAAQSSPYSMRVRLLCTYTGASPGGHRLGMSDLRRPSPEAQRFVADMARKSGIRNVPHVWEGPVPNAAAAIIGNQRIIIYNSDFMRYLLDRTDGNRWSRISVLAHELGHHLNGDAIDQEEGSTPPKELDADSASGLLMRRIGATLEDALIAMRTIGTPRATSTHPARADRLHAIRKGYEDDGDPDDRGRDVDDDGDPDDRGRDVDDDGDPDDRGPGVSTPTPPAPGPAPYRYRAPYYPAPGVTVPPPAPGPHTGSHGAPAAGRYRDEPAPPPAF